jgi:hypothetical protein
MHAANNKGDAKTGPQLRVKATSAADVAEGAPRELQQTCLAGDEAGWCSESKCCIQETVRVSLQAANGVVLQASAGLWLAYHNDVDYVYRGYVWLNLEYWQATRS